MACFIVPAAEAAITTIIKKKTDKNGNHTNPFIKRMKWLNNMLWGGSALLAFEHVWHGEITPFFPFLTNAVNPAEMLGEMATVGVGMAVTVTAVWACLAAAASSVEKRGASNIAVGGARK